MPFKKDVNHFFGCNFKFSELAMQVIMLGRSVCILSSKRTRLGFMSTASQVPSRASGSTVYNSSATFRDIESITSTLLSTSWDSLESESERMLGLIEGLLEIL